jgi:bifunctional non-homologous end joining protein LigD
MSAAQKKRKRFHPEAKRASMPASVDPMRPTLAAKPFSDLGWLFEPKWDGWRTLCFVRAGKVHLVSRRKNSLTERFPELKDIGKAIKATAALIDGEVVALGEDGLPQFDALRFRPVRKCSIVFYAFDLLHLDGFDLTGCPLIKRKALLRRILPTDNTGRIRFTDHIAGSGERLFEKLEALNLEGMVMERKDSVYAFTRCHDWLKVKTLAGKMTMQKRIETWAEK